LALNGLYCAEVPLRNYSLTAAAADDDEDDDIDVITVQIKI